MLQIPSLHSHHPFALNLQTTRGERPLCSSGQLKEISQGPPLQDPVAQPAMPMFLAGVSAFTIQQFTL